MLESASTIDWVRGDLLDLDIPAHPAALRAHGEAFLTAAFRAAGTLGKDNSVTQISEFRECPGGSTGRKLFLTVAYEKPAPGLHTDLFVKFSRDFDDPIRDQARDQLAPEVRLGLLSRHPDFPVAVPACYFADYHNDSGTGILITQRILFGQDGIEPMYEKCLDYKMPEPLAHYRAIVANLARLAGTQKSGRLTESIGRHFPFDPAAQSLAAPIRYNAEQLLRRVDKFSDFARRYPRLIQENIRSDDFIETLKMQIPRFLQHEQAIKDYLLGNPDLIALIHWNANVDNAWFWRNAEGKLECGLLDWGSVNQMNIALALWGALSAAETELWDEHLDELLGLFAAEFRNAGGPALAIEGIKTHLFLATTLMCLSWLMDAPAMILRGIPDLSEMESRFDPVFESLESPRVQLRMFTNFLNLWERHDFGRLLERFDARK